MLTVKKTVFKKIALLAIAVVFGWQSNMFAVETINLTAIDGYPTKALWVKEFINFYIPQVDKRLAAKGNYKIRWNQAWGGQIVKPKRVFEGVQKGLGDIGVVTTVFHHDKVPIQAIAYVTPFITTDPGLVARTVDEIAAKFPEMKATWDKYDQVYLTNMAVLDSYQIFSKSPIMGLADFKGKKINGAGTNLRYLQGLGSAGVGGSLVTYFQNLNAGVVDAAMIWPEAAISFKLVEVAPYMLKANIGTVNSKAVTVNKRTWNRLPSEVKEILAETAIDYRDHVATLALSNGLASYGKYEARGGKITTMSTADRNQWAMTMPNVAKQWAANLEKKGVPGKKILAYYLNRMRANGQKVTRDWNMD